MSISSLIKQLFVKKTQVTTPMFLYHLPYLVGPPEPVALFQTDHPSSFTKLADKVETYSIVPESFPWVARSLITGKDYCFPRSFNRYNAIRLLQSFGYAESYVSLDGTIKNVIY